MNSSDVVGNAPEVMVSHKGINVVYKTDAPACIAVLDSSFTMLPVVQDYYDLFNAGKAEGKWLTLNRIHVPDSEQESGIGTAMMEAFLSEVDRLKFNVLVHVSPYPGTELNRLLKFYHRFDFSWIYMSNVRDSALMHRIHK